MSKKKTRPHSRLVRTKIRKYMVIGSACLIALLAFGTIAGPWRVSSSKTKVGGVFLFPRSPTIPAPSSPSKEYIYAGGKLIATESNPLVAPASLVADTFSSSRIDVTWAAVPNAHHYQVERASNLGGSFTIVNPNVTTTSFSDTTVISVNAYLYRVRSADAGGNLSPPSAVDVATAITFTDDPLSQGTTGIKAQHISELRQAVNAVRAAANLSAAMWTDSSLTSVTIKAVHIQEMRSNLDQALTALGLATSAYTDASLAGVLIKKIHVDEIRQRVK